MNAFKRIWYILTLPCSEATRLASAGLERPLQWYETVALRAHRISCGPCRHFKKQLEFLTSTGRLADAKSTERLSEDAKIRLKQLVRELRSRDSE